MIYVCIKCQLHTLGKGTNQKGGITAEEYQQWHKESPKISLVGPTIRCKCD